MNTHSEITTDLGDNTTSTEPASKDVSKNGLVAFIIFLIIAVIVVIGLIIKFGSSDAKVESSVNTGSAIRVVNGTTYVVANDTRATGAQTYEMAEDSWCYFELTAQAQDMNQTGRVSVTGDGKTVILADNKIEGSMTKDNFGSHNILSCKNLSKHSSFTFSHKKI